ncbi:hypothetical protein [Actinokineospora enzanensis]|uniref:sulfotransferase-like domain-containing protein n=1 Tax=Actinokineospora enzanensis TaxID=155975 RepID=UPI00035C4812|nr:hypothetical protein [Actinokineospora enzanensis]
MPGPHSTYLVISPPRSASTALSRVIWNNPGVRYYSHEPYESTYFRGLDRAEASAALANPLDLADVVGAKTGDGLLVKEISFQLGDNLPDLLARTAHPVVFLLRDPRLTIASRRRVKELQSQPPDFPLVETGWHDLVAQIDHCRAHDVEHLVIDAFDFRSDPAPILRSLVEAWGLDFDPAQLSWQPRPGLNLSNHRVGGVDHYFTRVLHSRGLELPVEVPIPVADFPADRGLRDHVRWAMDQYERLRAAPEFRTGAEAAHR